MESTVLSSRNCDRQNMSRKVRKVFYGKKRAIMWQMISSALTNAMHLNIHLSVVLLSREFPSSTFGRFRDYVIFVNNISAMIVHYFMTTEEVLCTCNSSERKSNAIASSIFLLQERHSCLKKLTISMLWACLLFAHLISLLAAGLFFTHLSIAHSE